MIVKIYFKCSDMKIAVSLNIPCSGVSLKLDAVLEEHESSNGLLLCGDMAGENPLRVK